MAVELLSPNRLDNLAPKLFGKITHFISISNILISRFNVFQFKTDLTTNYSIQKLQIN